MIWVILSAKSWSLLSGLTHRQSCSIAAKFTRAPSHTPQGLGCSGIAPTQSTFGSAFSREILTHFLTPVSVTAVGHICNYCNAGDASTEAFPGACCSPPALFPSNTTSRPPALLYQHRVPCSGGSRPTPSMATLPPFPGEGRRLPHFPHLLPTHILARTSKPSKGFQMGKQQAGNNCFAVQLNLPSGTAKNHEFRSKFMNHFSLSSLLSNAF